MENSDFEGGDLVTYVDSSGNIHQGLLLSKESAMLRVFRFTVRDVVIVTIARCIYFETSDIDVMCDKSWWDGLIADCQKVECLVLDGKRTKSGIPKLLLQPKHTPNKRVWVGLEYLHLIGHVLTGSVTRPRKPPALDYSYLGRPH